MRGGGRLGDYNRSTYQRIALKMDKTEKLKALGARIRKVRTEKGLSMEELGEAIKTRYQQIQRLEKGETNPSMYFLREVSGGLGVGLDKLLKELE